MNNISNIQKVIPIVSEVSPTFCMAKWHHTTIYLQTGQTHSCYHPRPHTIPLGELANNPSALHNTLQKKDERRLMMNGEKPSGCKYCWDIEDLGPEHISDRHERNGALYNPARLKEIVDDPYKNFNPDYIEISFGNECNFKCGYCHPRYSSAYYKEIKDHGPYTMVKNHRNDIDWFTLYEEETNPYVKAWWDWWPEVSKTLGILRITGGEPLLQQSTWRLFDELDKNPQPNLEININSNLGVKPILIDRLCERVNKLLNERKIKRFKLFTSIDTWGPAVEYVRTGMDLAVWEQNLDTYLTKTRQPIDFMVTFNNLIVPSFITLMRKVIDWRSKYNKILQTDWQRIRFDINWLREPIQYDINILPKDEFMPYMYETLEYMKNNQGDVFRDQFLKIEVEKFASLVKYMETTNLSPERLAEGRKDFVNWFDEHDRRRGTDFKKTFPELVEFYNNCKGSE